MNDEDNFFSRFSNDNYDNLKQKMLGFTAGRCLTAYALTRG